MNDIDYLKLLTTTSSLGAEDGLASALFRPLSFGQLAAHIRRHQKSVPDANSSGAMKLYIHMPYCASLCSYCHCTRFKLKNSAQLKQFVNRVKRQIHTLGPLFQKTQFRSFSFLGGTVPLLDTKSLDQVLKNVFLNFSFSQDARLILEGHPQRLIPQKLELAKHYGINQISLGIQSMDAAVLKAINRNQTPEDVKRCIRNIKHFRFERIDADIMAGLPHQTVTSFLKDIQTLIDWGIDIIHINPFCNITESQYSQCHAIDISSLLVRRNTMILKAKALLEKHGFLQKGFSGYQRSKAAIQENEEQPVCPGNVLGLGMFAKSNLSGELLFEDVPSSSDAPASIRYKGYAIDRQYTMASYAQLHLLKGLKRPAFKLLFGQDIESAFKKEFPLLLNAGLIVKDQDTYRYSGPWTIHGLFDYYTYTKILLSRTLLRDLKHAHQKQGVKNNYMPEQSFVLRLLQDLSFVRTYYNLGQKTCWLSS